MSHRGKPYNELPNTDIFAFYSIEAIKHWREQEHAAGRPSGLEDFYHAHDLCWACRATGVSVNPIDWDGEKRFFESCPVCGGTGKLSTS